MPSRVRVGVLGAGSWADAAHLPALAARDDVEIVVVSRRNGALAREIASRFGAGHATDDWREALDHRLDAVIVASPPSVHEEQVTAALQSGAHVLCEKPLAIQPDVAWRMVDAARVAGRTLLVSFGWNYTPLMQAARRLLEGPQIGQLEFVSVEIRIAGRRLLLRAEPYLGSSVDVPPQPATYIDPEISGGGQSAVTMSHVFGLALFLTRLTPTDVVARMWTGPLGVDVHDATIVTFREGAVGSVNGASIHDGLPRTEWNILVIGSGGQVYLDSSSRDLHFASPAGEIRRPSLPVDPYHDATSGALNELISVARGGQPSDAGSAQLGALSVELVAASLISAASGRVEPLGPRASAIAWPEPA